MTRVAILHFTGPPAVGGIESTILAQVTALRELDARVRVVVGRGEQLTGAETVVVPELHPADERVASATSKLTLRFPEAQHPLVRSLVDAIDTSLRNCDACWVHNAFTVYLNPFLTVALWVLVERRQDVKWVAWCEDLSGTSRFQAQLHGTDAAAARRPLPGVTYVTISETRRREIAGFLRTPASTISVIAPPLDADSWLGLSKDTVQLAAKVGLEEALPSVLVPAKLLPHKGLDRVLGVATCLADMCDRPVILISGAASPHDPDTSRNVANRLRTQIAGLGLKRNLHLVSDETEGVPSARMVRELMMLSDLVFVPSREEGFGVPLREAAALRVPVLCSDIPVFREVAGDSARYFGLGDKDVAVAERIVDVASSSQNVARRAALRSTTVFRRQIAHLLRGFIAA